jgi:hypothetical protein
VASLLLAGAIELLGGGVASVLPACRGAKFQVAPGYDLSSPQSVTDLVGQLILDGSRPFGRRADNRTITLPIVITVPPTGNNLADQATLTGARETLLSLIDAQTWTLTWTRDGGNALIFDCFRAQPSVVTYSVRQDRNLVSRVAVSFQALPYGRSDTPQQLAFASPVSGTPAQTYSPVTLDDYETVSGSHWSASSAHITGSFSAHWSAPSSRNNAPTYASTFAAKDLTGLSVLQHWAGFASPSYWYYWGSGSMPVTLTYTLWDNAGRSMQFGTSLYTSVSSSNGSPQWNLVSANIPSPSGGFDITHVVECDITIANYGGYQLNYTDAFLDSLTAQPVTTTAPASVRGSLYTLHGVVGTSHAPLNLQFTQTGGVSFPTLIAHRPGPDSPTNLTPFVSTANVTDPPDGRQYNVTSQISGQNARFNGTYTIVAVANSWNSPSSSRTVTISVYQFEYSGGPSSVQTVSRTFVPSTDITNGLLVVGELTLPGKDIPPGNSAAYFTVGITDTITSDQYLDVLFLDVAGETVIINEAGSGYPAYFIDEPTPDRDLGRVLGSSSDRTRAVSVLDSAFVSGGPLTVDGGNDCQLLAYSATGAPAIAATYSPRWYVERLA